MVGDDAWGMLSTHCQVDTGRRDVAFEHSIVPLIGMISESNKHCKHTEVVPLEGIGHLKAVSLVVIAASDATKLT